MAEDSSQQSDPDENGGDPESSGDEHAPASRLLRNARAALRAMLASKPRSGESESSDSS